MKKSVRWSALLLGGMMLLGTHATAAQEMRRGDYIYVPAMSAPSSVGEIGLRVEGLSLLAGSDEPVKTESLAGAEFGVYVVSEDGELTPWANPLYPSEQMRIRTGEETVMFTLPDNTEFYLRQESAPQGYRFDAAQVIPVTGDEIVVSNTMPGELLVQAVDTLGTPLAGVEVLLTDEAGYTAVYLTDENGEVVLACEEETVYSVSEGELPKGVFPALSAELGGAQVSGAEGIAAHVEPSRRTRLTYEHPASGSVQLSMQIVSINEYGETEYAPLSGVSMEIVGQTTIMTDEAGQAQASLLEGMYDVRFAYTGSEEVILPLSEGQMIVQSGAATVIELNASCPKGRAVFILDAPKTVEGGCVQLTSEQTGAVYGPYEFDADGMAVTEELDAGMYWVSSFEAPVNMQLGGYLYEGAEDWQTDSFVLSVSHGEASQVTVSLLTRESQTFDLFAARMNDEGSLSEERLTGDMTFDLLTAQGEEKGSVQASGGLVQVEGLSGSYVLRMQAQDAEELGLKETSEVFELPAQDGSITFGGVEARLRIAAVDSEGQPLSGAVFMVTDAAGEEIEVTCGESGAVLTPALLAGEITITALNAPEGYAEAAETRVIAGEGDVLEVYMQHARYGTAQISVLFESLDDQGALMHKPLAHAGVRLYRLYDDGQRMSDTGIQVRTDEAGVVELPLEPGAYIAQIEADSIPDGCTLGESLRLNMENEQTAQGELICMDALGGVRVSVTGNGVSSEMLAQMRFELEAVDGSVMQLKPVGESFYIGELPSGTYLLRQTQIPEGFNLAKERTLQVSGAQVTMVQVPLEEYAVVSVSKTGLTFNDRLQTFVVPLTGQYGVYVRQDGEMKPYPSEGEQLTVWSNVTAEQMAQGMAGEVRLPAAVDGSVYYLREISSAEGFAADETYHEVVVIAGEEKTIDCAVSSDRGFFMLEQLDMADGKLVSGGDYELIDVKTGEKVLGFTPENGAYRNSMAIPVGSYLLRQTASAPGYTLPQENELMIEVQPYLTQGGYVAQASMPAMKLPQEGDLALIGDIYDAREQGMTFVSVDTGSLLQGESLIRPQLTIQLSAQDNQRVNVAGVVLGSAGDSGANAYIARVEYSIAGGGWQPSDARMTGELTVPTAVNLADVEDDITAVRVTYINAQTGEEVACEGFSAGTVTLNVAVGSEQSVSVQADARMSGLFAYKTHVDEPEQMIERVQEMACTFTAQGDGAFRTVSAGHDGRITGVAFFDNDADGVMSAQETGRYAGLEVSLINASGDMIETVRTDAQGRYAFNAISCGQYTVQFGAGSHVIYSHSDRYSEHVVSGVVSPRDGMSDELIIDGDHTDYVINAGCIYAASLSGSVAEIMTDDTMAGFESMTIEMIRTDAGVYDEPTVVMTDGMGRFAISGILPGTYEVTLHVPQGYLCDEAEDGLVVKTLTFGQGETADLGQTVIAKASSISGSVLIDDDGDGVIGDMAQPVAGVDVALLQISDGHSAQIAKTTTNEHGGYSFDGLHRGEYSVLFDLGGEWTFTRFGEDSLVYGAVSQSGSTQVFALAAGESAQQINAGVAIPAQLSVMVFKDTQADGQKGVYETGLEGASVTLIRMENGEDAESVTIRTDEDGMAVFAGVSPGEYVLAYELPGMWRATRQVDPQTTNYPVSCVPASRESEGRSEPFTLTMGQSGMTRHIGAMLTGAITGTVYYDDDADARMGADEAACAGAQVELLSAAGEVIDTQTTGADGYYSFEGIAPARYRVRFTAQEGCGFSATEVTMARGGVQESDENVSATRYISVYAGNTVSTADAGIVRLGSLRGMVWEDSNADCVIAEGERGLEGVTVHLMNGAGRIIVSTTATDAQGGFVFERLRPGMYKLRVDAPQNYVFSGALEGSALELESEREGRGYSVSFELLGGAHAQGIGFGLLTQGTISGKLWEDADYNGVMNDEEKGLRGASLVLMNAAGEEAARTQSLRSGEFRFDELMPGEYTLYATLPEGYVFTADGKDSLIAHATEQTAGLYLGTLTMGGSIEDVHIGALVPSVLGGKVFIDDNNDGRMEQRDAGMPDVEVTLTVTEGADAGKSMTVKTDVNGEYRFESVMPGRVQVGFLLPQGYAFAKKAAGARNVSIVAQTDALYAQSDAIDVLSGKDQLELSAGAVSVGTISGAIWQDDQYDGKRNSQETGLAGAQIELIDAASGETVRSAVSGVDGRYVVDFVRAGTYSVRVTLPDGMIFTRAGESALADVDGDHAATERFELSMGESVTELNFGAISPACVAGYVILDEDENGTVQAQEAGMSGATVTLMQGGTVVSTAKSSADGRFELNMLRPGTYRVRIALPENALFSVNCPLHLAYADAQEGETQEFTLDMGQQIQLDAVAAVEGAMISGSAWSDMNADGWMDSEEPVMTGVMAELISDGEVIASAKVSAEGVYAFSLLRSGSYSVRFTLPEDMLLADRREGDRASSANVVPGNVGETDVMSVSMGEKRMDVHIGGIMPGRIGDTVWHDADGNGLQDYREELVSGFGLTLLRVNDDGSMTEAAAVQSDEYGYYCFDLLRPGSYVLRAQTQDGDQLTMNFGAPLGEIDSDIDPQTGMSGVIRLESGQVIRNIDVGLKEIAQ